MENRPDTTGLSTIDVAQPLGNSTNNDDNTSNIVAAHASHSTTRKIRFNIAASDGSLV